MSSAELERLARIGQLRVEPPTEGEVEGLDVWRVLAKAHEARNRAEYEGSSEVDDGLLDDVIGAAQSVRAALRWP